ncbi:MAG: glycosyltransferase family 4 protein [Persicimonas sp.]
MSEVSAEQRLDVWVGAAGTGNPYMELLEQHIEEQGAELYTTYQAHKILIDLAFRDAPDIFHIHWLGMYFLSGRAPDWKLRGRLRMKLTLAAFERLKERGAKLVWTAHNLHNHEKRLFDIDREIHHRVARMVDGVIVHSPSAERKVRQTYEFAPSTELRVIPHGHYIDVYPPSSTTPDQVRARYGIAEDDFVVLFFGRLRDYKNVTGLIEAFAEADLGESAHVIIAGASRTRRLARELQSAAEGRPRVHLDDRFIDDEEVISLFEASDAVALPYEAILTSGSAVLAMSMGRAVIAPRLGGLVDLLEHQSELLYDPDDSAGLVGALERARAARGELAEIGRANKKEARRWDWPTIGRRTVELYRDVLAT